MRVEPGVIVRLREVPHSPGPPPDETIVTEDVGAVYAPGFSAPREAAVGLWDVALACWHTCSSQAYECCRSS